VSLPTGPFSVNRRLARRLCWRSLSAVVLLLVTGNACSVTWREPEIQPLLQTRVLPGSVDRICAAVTPVLADLGLLIDQEESSETACLVVTNFHRLAERGPRVERLREVAYLGPQDVFQHARYRLTVTVQEAADHQAQVRIASRIEGYDGSYRQLRSTGLIEGQAFAFLQQRVGVDPARP